MEGRVKRMKATFRVLVVDDHPLFAQATKQILDQIERIEVVGVVGNGRMCMEFMRERQPELVFLDYHLPDVPGSQIAESIRKQFPSTHIIIFTGFDVNDLFNSLVELGVSGILSK